MYIKYGHIDTSNTNLHIASAHAMFKINIKMNHRNCVQLYFIERNILETDIC